MPRKRLIAHDESKAKRIRAASTQQWIDIRVKMVYTMLENMGPNSEPRTRKYAIATLCKLLKTASAHDINNACLIDLAIRQNDATAVAELVRCGGSFRPCSSIVPNGYVQGCTERIAESMAGVGANLENPIEELACLLVKTDCFDRELGLFNCIGRLAGVSTHASLTRAWNVLISAALKRTCHGGLFALDLLFLPWLLNNRFCGPAPAGKSLNMLYRSAATYSYVLLEHCAKVATYFSVVPPDLLHHWMPRFLMIYPTEDMMEGGKPVVEEFVRAVWHDVIAAAQR